MSSYRILVDAFYTHCLVVVSVHLNEHSIESGEASELGSIFR